VLPTATYLEGLNPAQRRAVEHGIRQGSKTGPPLLIIAGAGSGKTNTLAHRVAHLIVNGADPRRILLILKSDRVLGATVRLPRRAMFHPNLTNVRSTCGGAASVERVLMFLA